MGILFGGGSMSQEDFQDGIVTWGKATVIISMVIEIMEEGKYIKLDPVLRIPEVAIRDFTEVSAPKKFKELGPYFAYHLNNIIYASICKQTIQEAFLTGLLQKEHELELKKFRAEDIFPSVDGEVFVQAMQALAKGDVEQFVLFVKDFFITSLSYFDINEHTEEKSYHLFLLGMSTYFANTHHVRSNRESGHGRYDIALEPMKKGMKAIILELKVADKGKDLKEVAKDALKQTQNRQYKTDMEARGVTDFVLLGMAFRGKEMEVVTS
ncbi:MAG: PD-(D/E)XK nuclease domain-containing protein [Bacteroidota bacterium]